MKEPDEDIGLALNTLVNIEPFKMPYPAVEYEDSTTHYRPKVITISDSYWGTIYYSYLSARIFKEPEYWYFYNQNFDYGPGVLDPLALHLKRKIETSDVVIIMCTEAHIGDIGWGFIEDAYELYTQGEKTQKERQKEICLLRIKRGMKTDLKWTFNMEQEAKKEKVSIDSVKTRTANWVFENQHWYSFAEENSSISKNIIDLIKANHTWNESLTAKAKSKKISPESLISKEATLIYENREMIQLKASNNKFICAEEGVNSVVIANREKANSWETFSLIKFGKNECAIYSHNNYFLSAQIDQQGEITATRTKIDSWEIFTIIELENDYVAFKASNGKYIIDHNRIKNSPKSFYFF